MIEYIKGELTDLTPALATIEVAGIGYGLNISLNTFSAIPMHKVAPIIQERISVPIVHIADATGDEIIKRGFGRVAFLGTKFTMTQEFYTK